MSDHTRPEHVVVVGGGVGGVSTCGDLRRLGYTGSLTLIDSGSVLHDRPPLSKDFLLGRIDRIGLCLQREEWFAQQNVTVRTGETVARVRPEEGYVELTDGSRLPAEAVVLATGGTARRLPVPGGDGDRVHYLRTLDDAERLQPHLTDGARVMVIGAGLIGAEIAGTARALGCDVTITDPALPLEAALGEDLARWLHTRHAERGARVLDADVETIVHGLEGTDGSAGAIVHLTAGEPVIADVVIVGIGMVPETSVAAASGAVVVTDGVVVDAHQRTSVPGLYAIGDCSHPKDAHGNLLPRIEHWEAAIHGAARAAAAICGVEPPRTQAEWYWSDRHGVHLEVVGNPVAGEQIVRGTFGEPPFAILSFADGQVVGAASVNDPKTVRAARRLIDRRTPVTAEDLATGDLRKLARGKS